MSDNRSPQPIDDEWWPFQIEEIGSETFVRVRPTGADATFLISFDSQPISRERAEKLLIKWLGGESRLPRDQGDREKLTTEFWRSARMWYHLNLPHVLSDALRQQSEESAYLAFETVKDQVSPTVQVGGEPFIYRPILSWKTRVEKLKKQAASAVARRLGRPEGGGRPRVVSGAAEKLHSYFISQGASHSEATKKTAEWLSLSHSAVEKRLRR